VSVAGGFLQGAVGLLTFMMGIGSSPGEPRSSIMFLINMLRSAILRSAVKSQYDARRKSVWEWKRIPVTISTPSLETSLTLCSPSEDMLEMVMGWKVWVCKCKWGRCAAVSR
jgi:hypothetical protein